MKKNDNYFSYHFFSSILKFVGNIVYGGKVIGKENLNIDNGFVLAGNHVSSVDCYLFYKSLKRPIYTIGKKELYDSKLAWFFKIMNVIPVDRKNKNPKAKEEAINKLKDGNIILIFPEGTFHKKEGELLLPFKPGAIDFSIKADVPIVPFAIISKFKFRCNPKIVFGKPFYAKDIKEEDRIKYLEDVVRNLIIENS